MSLARMMVRSTKMFRQVVRSPPPLQRPQPSSFITPLRVPVPRPIHHLAIHHETVEEMICRYVSSKYHRWVSGDGTENCRYECIFGRDDADGWDVRQAMNDLAGYDSVPEPRIIIAALHACRRLNDYALAVRFLELVKDKCGNKVNEIYPYIVQVVTF